MILPSKELLSAIYGKTVTRRDSSINEISNELYFEVELIDDYEQHYVNIYELIHLMKEWILNKDLFFASNVGVCDIYDIHVNRIFEERSCESEFEAVTKACEWILEEKLHP